MLISDFFMMFFCQMEDDVLKIAVINRTRHKRSYHGFGVLELKDLLRRRDEDVASKESNPLFSRQWSDVEVTILPSVSEKLVKAPSIHAFPI